jgi:23S rRNA pseudouridine1911/1915/1917 synthase
VTALVRAIAAREVHRDTSRSRTAGRPAQFGVDAPIGRDPQSRVRMAVVASGKPARPTSSWIAARARSAACAARCTPGARTRSACTSRRRAPAGGRRGLRRRAALGMQRQALHAARLRFAHPDGRTLDSRASPPADFARPGNA